LAADNNAWAASHGALEFYNGTASTFIVGIDASDTCTNGQIPKFNTAGNWTCEDDATGGTTAYDDIGNPDAAKTITFAGHESTWTGSETAADQYNFINTGAIGDISVFKIEHNTGNATDGTLLELVQTDTDIDPLDIKVGGSSVYNFGADGVLTIAAGGGIVVTPNSTAAQYSDYYEDTDDGSNYHRIQGQAFASNRTTLLPDYNAGFLASDQVDSGGDLADASVDPGHLADADHGDVAWSGGVATVQAATGTFELGHASDTTLARSAAGAVTVEGNQVVLDSDQDRWQSVGVAVAGLIADGTNCTDPDSEQINSGPNVWFSTCSDAAGTLEVGIPMPENWDGGSVYVELAAGSNEASPSGTVEFEVSAQARGNDDLINNTWVTGDNIQFGSNIDTQYDVVVAESDEVTGLSGAGGDMLYVRVTRDNDDGTNDTSTQSVEVWGMRVYYQIDDMDERD
jgi:hypothetical protein